MFVSLSTPSSEVTLNSMDKSDSTIDPNRRRSSHAGSVATVNSEDLDMPIPGKQQEQKKRKITFGLTKKRERKAVLEYDILLRTVVRPILWVNKVFGLYVSPIPDPGGSSQIGIRQLNDSFANGSASIDQSTVSFIRAVDESRSGSLPPIRRKSLSQLANSSKRSNRAYLWSCFLICVHMVMACDDLLMFVGRLQADGFFHKDTLIGLLFCSFQWHAILLIMHHVCTYKRLHVLINKLLTFETTYYTRDLRVTDLTTGLRRRALILGVGCMLLLIPSAPLYVLYFFHLASVEQSFAVWKDCFVMFCPLLMTCTMLAALMLYFVVVEILTAVFENSHKAIGVDSESVGSGPSIFEMRQLKRNFFNLVDHAQLCDSVFTWQNFVTISFATGNICLSVFTYIRMHGDTEAVARRDRFGFTPIMLLCILNFSQLFVLLTVMVCGSKFNGKARVLKHWLLRQDDICDPESKHAVDCLLWKLYDKDWGLTAGNFFLLDQGALLTTIGVIITYMTVLLQLGWQTTNMGYEPMVSCPSAGQESFNFSDLETSRTGIHLQ